MRALTLTATGKAAPAPENPDDLYRRREDLQSAKRAAALWEARASLEFEAAWKLSRVCSWIGTHARDEPLGAAQRNDRGWHEQHRGEPE
jgi:hypothetical protein